METTEMMNERRNRCGRHKHKTGWIILGIIGFTALAALFGAVIMWLWNGLMPEIFHLGIITYWQAVGLAILGRLLFGSMHHGRHSHRSYHRMGPWKYRGRMSHGDCHDISHGMKWSYYDQYWNEEGEKAFNDYIQRKAGTPEAEK